MSMGVFVVNNTGQVGSSTCRAVLGYKNALSASIASGTGVTNQDADFPLSLAFDYSYNTEYSPDVSLSASSVQIVFSPTSLQQIDYFMIISKNAEESELSVTVEAFIPDEGAYVEVAGFGSMSDGVPVMVYFGGDYENGYVSALSIRVTLNYTSKPYIMSMMCGKAIVFPRTFSLGFQPASTANMDEVRMFNADEGLNIVSGRRLKRGYHARGSINYVRMSTVKTFWKDFTEHVLDSKPFCLMWNDTAPTDIVYGVQNPDRHTKPTYKTSLFTQIDFDIIGWA